MTDEGYLKGQSDNLPKVDSLMIANFFSRNVLFCSAEIRGTKAARAGHESYGDSAVGYVQVKRDGTECTVKSKICPEHKVRSKNYNVSVQINEQTEEVLNTNCHDCAASEGGCKHAVAFLMWLHRRSEEPAPTEVARYWRKSKLASVGTSLKFIRVQDFGQINSHCSSPNLSTQSREFIADVIKEGIARKSDSQVLKYFQDETDPLKNLGMHQLMDKFILNGGKTAQEFITFSKNLLSVEICQQACEATVDQSSSKLWHELRYGRITASRIYEVFRCKTASGSLVENIVGSMKIKESLAMIRGKQLESQVLHVLENETKIKFKPAGLLLSNKFPFLGASPDAISEDFVVEIKCPSTEKTFTLYLKESKITNKCNGQIQLQMLLFKKKKGIFCVADPNFEENNKINIQYIEFDREFIFELVHAAEIFWCSYIFPLLFSSLTENKQ